MKKYLIPKNFLINTIDWPKFLILLIRCPIIVTIICILFNFDLIMTLSAIFISTTIWGINILYSCYKMYNKIKNDENYKYTSEV